MGKAAQSQLLDVVDALRPPRCFARSVDGRQKQCDQQRDDRNNNEQLYQCETVSTMRPSQWSCGRPYSAKHRSPYALETGDLCHIVTFMESFIHAGSPAR